MVQQMSVGCNRCVIKLDSLKNKQYFKSFTEEDGCPEVQYLLGVRAIQITIYKK